MLGVSFGIKGAAIAFAIGLAVGGTAGWRGEKAFSDSRWFKAQAAALGARVATLETRIRVANAATTQDQQRAAEAERLRQQAEERAKNAEDRIANTPAFDAADTERLLDLWRPQARGAAKR